MAVETMELAGAVLGTGASSALMTVVALRVHIQYLREIVARHETAIQRAHERIDKMAEQA